jgi:hypothetical protein
MWMKDDQQIFIIWRSADFYYLMINRSLLSVMETRTKSLKLIAFEVEAIQD